jgi:hypothetical protein
MGASGGSSTGSPGSRLTWRALGGIAFGFSALLSGRHSNLARRDEAATFTHPNLSLQWANYGRVDTQMTTRTSGSASVGVDARAGLCRGVRREAAGTGLGDLV